VYIASWESNELENVILFKIKWYILSWLIFSSPTLLQFFVLHYFIIRVSSGRI